MVQALEYITRVKIVCPASELGDAVNYLTNNKFHVIQEGKLSKRWFFIAEKVTKKTRGTYRGMRKIKKIKTTVVEARKEEVTFDE